MIFSFALTQDANTIKIFKKYFKDCSMYHMLPVTYHLFCVTCHQRQQTLPLIPPPLCTVGWYTKTEPKYPKKFKTKQIIEVIPKNYRLRETLYHLTCAYSSTNSKMDRNRHKRIFFLNIMCLVTCVTCHMSWVACHLSPVTNENSHIHRPSHC